MLFFESGKYIYYTYIHFIFQQNLLFTITVMSVNMLARNVIYNIVYKRRTLCTHLHKYIPIYIYIYIYIHIYIYISVYLYVCTKNTSRCCVCTVDASADILTA